MSAEKAVRICTICVRGGSKGVPGKNLRLIAGKPLLTHSIAQALESGLFMAVGVSSDDAAILRAATEAGATHIVDRPAEMASDQAAKLPAIRHCVETVEAQSGLAFDTMVDLDATSPLRLVEDIANVVRLLERGDGNVITAMPSRRSPYFNLIERQPDGTINVSKPRNQGIVRRQDAPACYDMNASIYAWRRKDFFDGPAVFRPDTRLYVMPEERSLDIDSPLDWELVSYLMEKRKTET